MRSPWADPTKQLSRVLIWDELVSFRPPSRANVLIFPGDHTYEYDLLLRLGYRPPNIWLVDRDGNVLIRFLNKVRRPPPVENCLPMWLSRATAELYERGAVLDVVHLDFCENVEGQKFMKEVTTFIRSQVLAPRCRVAITWQRGREHIVDSLTAVGTTVRVQTPTSMIPSHALQEFQVMSNADRGRLWKIWCTFEGSVAIRRIGHYRNSNALSHMSWAIFERKA